MKLRTAAPINQCGNDCPQPTVQSSALQRRSQRGRWATVKRLACRLDVCWTFFFFIFIVCVGSVTATITQSLIRPYVLGTWHTLHHLRMSAANTRIDQDFSLVDRMADAFMSLHLQQALPMQSEDTLALACSVLASYDRDMVVRALLPASSNDEMVACIHGLADTNKLSTLTGFISHNHSIDGTYLVDSTTMRFARPLRKVRDLAPDRRNVGARLDALLTFTRVFDVGMAYYNGSIKSYDRRVSWFSPPSMPHLFYYILPVSMVARGLKVNRSLNDYVQVRVDGSRVLFGNAHKHATGLSIAAFIPQSLTFADPKVLATSWGQNSVSNNSIFLASAVENVTYLAVSDISDPLMRAALQHVNLTHLLRRDCHESTDFYYRGATATVTAVTYTTHNGCVLHLVYASSHATIAGPYRRSAWIARAFLIFSEFLFTALFWVFVHTQFSTPLLRMGELMLCNVEAHTRVMFVAGSTTWMRLKEVCRLTRAHNQAVRRLQEIEVFIPVAVRNYFAQHATYARSLVAESSASESSPTELDAPQLGHLTSLTLSVVYVMLRPAPEINVHHEPPSHLLRCQVNAAPDTAGPPAAESEPSRVLSTVNSGPFRSPAALGAFMEAVHELSAQHHGVVYRLCPDNCVVHFGQAVASVAATASNGAGGNDTPHEVEMTTVADVESGVRRDARDALGFVCALESFTCEPRNGVEVDLRMLVDTTSFVCGHYRGRHSEHLLPVALSRDVQRDIGPLLPALKVRVAMTEETARRVRAEWTSRLEPGVRQLPIDAISTGRAGSNQDVVLLYEVLPGSVAGDRVWQRYAQRCFEGFSHMLRGEYVEALTTYSRIREISDLEPGLMPPSLSREAALSFVTGGAVSTQVERLMAECRRCVAQHITSGYCRTRRVPPGVGSSSHATHETSLSLFSPAHSPATLRSSQQPLQQRRLLHTTLVVATATSSSSHGSSVDSCPPSLLTSRDAADQRYVVTTIEDDNQKLRHVVGDPPRRVVDNFQQRWKMSRPFRCAGGADLVQGCVVGLRSTGMLCSASQLLLRQVPPIVSKAVKDAHDGFLSDALRSAVPVCGPTPAQCAQLQAVVNAYSGLNHPNLLLPQSYSFSVEGAVVLLWPRFPGCTLRELLRRYPRMSPFTVCHFTLSALTALAYLHAQHLVHGELSLDSVLAAPDGTGLLLTRCCGHRMARELFVVPRTRYVSPAMAAGALPTPACDVFCYGLMCLDVFAGGMVWKWAPCEEGKQQPQQHSEEELRALLRDCDRALYDAVAHGALVPNMEALEVVSSTNFYRELVCVTVRACLSLDPAKRPTAEQLCALTRLYVSNLASTTKQRLQ